MEKIQEFKNSLAQRSSASTMGNRLSPNVQKDTEEGTIVCGTRNETRLPYCAVSMMGRRTTMEDRHLACTVGNCAIFGVFDGHGGVTAAKFASKYLPSIFQKQVAWKSYVDLMGGEQKNSSKAKRLLEQTLTDAFLELDRELLLLRISQEEKMEAEGKSVNKLKDSGTTANVILVADEWIVCGNLGDSRSMVLKSEGSFVELSEDHRPQHREEETRIRKAGGYVFGGRIADDLAVSRSFGDFRFKDMEATMHGVSSNRVTQRHQQVIPLPDVRFCACERDVQYLFLGCDGIFEKLTNEKVARTLHRELGGNDCLKSACVKVRYIYLL